MEPGAAEVALDDGRVLSRPLVVGAEGRGSVVAPGGRHRRDRLGLSADRRGRPPCGWSAPHEGVAHEYFLPGGPFAILPLDRRSGQPGLDREHGARRGRSKTARPEVFQAHLQRPVRRLPGRGRRWTGRCSPIRCRLQLAERLSAPRVALLGDAAHGVHPIAGQGLNLGLKGAAALAEVLVDALRLGEDIGSEAVLERYAAGGGSTR